MTEEVIRELSVKLLSRVEGEGRFRMRLSGDQVLEAELSIFEAPRLFEAMLRGRMAADVPDIVARICGICPIAYQLSAGRALEDALGFTTDATIDRLRRLVYCGEWIESHALHIHMLHAPDFLGLASVVEMAANHRELVERGLAIKKIGNQLIEVIGGRATHPVGLRVGGFSKAPQGDALSALAVPLQKALDMALATVRWAASLTVPPLMVPYVFVALDGGPDYPLERGDQICLGAHDRSWSRRVPVARYGEDEMVEKQVPHSNALQATLRDGTPFLTGPMARLHHHADRLHPRAQAIMEDVGLPPTVCNPHRSIVVRAVELVHALAEAIDLIAAYQPPMPPFVAMPSRAAIGYGATEAPRGLLWHRYETDADGRILDARIVPPTSQNQARIEADLVAMAKTLAAMDQGTATLQCERLIRAYDPCISCATHFLDLDIERTDYPAANAHGGPRHHGDAVQDGGNRARSTQPE